MGKKKLLIFPESIAILEKFRCNFRQLFNILLKKCNLKNRLRRIINKIDITKNISVRCQMRVKTAYFRVITTLYIDHGYL